MIRPLLLALLLTGCTFSTAEPDTLLDQARCGWAPAPGDPWQIEGAPGECTLLAPPTDKYASSLLGAGACDVEPGPHVYAPGDTVVTWVSTIGVSHEVTFAQATVRCP